MLAMAKAATASRTALTIDWREADVSALPFPDGSFDVALCQRHHSRGDESQTQPPHLSYTFSGMARHEPGATCNVKDALT